MKPQLLSQPTTLNNLLVSSKAGLGAGEGRVRWFVGPDHSGHSGPQEFFTFLHANKHDIRGKIRMHLLISLNLRMRHL